MLLLRGRLGVFLLALLAFLFALGAFLFALGAFLFAALGVGGLVRVLVRHCSAFRCGWW